MFDRSEITVDLAHGIIVRVIDDALASYRRAVEITPERRAIYEAWKNHYYAVQDAHDDSIVGSNRLRRTIARQRRLALRCGAPKCHHKLRFYIYDGGDAERFFHSAAFSMYCEALPINRDRFLHHLHRHEFGVLEEGLRRLTSALAVYRDKADAAPARKRRVKPSLHPASDTHGGKGVTSEQEATC